MKRNIKKVISIILSVMVITTMVPMNLISASAAEYDTGKSGLSGTGTVDDPYLIYNANDYKEFANLVNNGNTSISATLMADITFNTNVVDAYGNLNSGSFESVTPIATSGKYYNGTFNGNGYTISGAYITSTDNYTGLFGMLDSSGNITKLNVEDSYVQGTYYVAGICAYNSGSISDCTFEGLVEGGSYVGGISGWNSKYGYGDAVSRCANFGAVKATGQNAGGVAAYVYNTTVTNCYNTGEVNGTNNVGGVVGYNDRYAQTSNSHNVGIVTGTSNYVGAVCGRDSASIKNCYYLDENLVTDGNGTVQNGIGYYSKGQAQDDVSGNTTGYYDYMYESGIVTYELNNGVTDGTQVWYQTLGEDMYPVFSGKTVYMETSECPYREPWYTNDSTPLGHDYENGFCVFCDAYEPAVDTDNDGYYEIDNGGKLYWFAEQVNAGNPELNAVLTKDIYVNKDVLGDDGMNQAGTYRAWTPIGNNTVQYEGTFDGKNHTISGLYFNDNTVDYVALIGYNRGTVQNVGLLDSYFYGDSYTGGIAGYNSGDINCCYNESYIKGSSYTGGIAGDNYGTIANSGNTGRIMSSQFAGGITGHKRTGSLYNCYSTGYVAAYSYIGSICGNAYYMPSNCYYIPGRASDGGSVQQAGVGGFADQDGVTTAKTAEQFASGEVTYLLNKGVTDGTQVWYQTIGTDAVPNFEGETVYCGYVGCSSADKVYSNTKLSDTEIAHNYENGFCTVCDAYEPALDTDNDGYVEIDNGGKLYWYAQQVNAGETTLNAILTADIYVNENVLAENGEVNYGDYREWTPIGNSDTNFEGTFDGKGHTISGLYFNDNTVDYVALIGYNRGTVQNVGLLDSYFYADSSVGAICGYSEGSEITNCFNESAIISSGEDVGGICGNAPYSTIKECYNKGLIEGYQYVGGICGSNGFGGSTVIDKCYNTGTIKGTGYVGGIFGMVGEEFAEDMEPTTKITKCYNTGKITTSGIYVGGIGGAVYGPKVSNCYNIGSVSGESSVGGLIGYNEMLAELSNSYSIGEVTGTSYNVGSICGENAATITNCYYIGNTAFDGNNRRQYGIGVSTLGENQYDTTGCTIETWDIELKDGRITYALNNGVTDGTQAWYQTIGTDTAPNFNGKTVYCGYKDCKSTEKEYSNTKLYAEIPQHNFENGACTICGEKEPVQDVTIYLKPNSNWPKDKARFSAYLWTGAENIFVDMVDTNGDGYYEITVKEGWENIIFCRMDPDAATNWDNAWNQTNDLVIPYDGRNCYTIAEGAWSNGDGTWSEYTPPERAVSIFGDINLALVSSDENIFTGAVEIDEGTYSFNVNDNGTVVGFNYTFTDTATIDYSAGYKSPTKLVVSGGRYIFTYNSTSKKLTIKYKPFADIVELFGDINVELVRTSADSTVFTGSARVEAGSYTFKINDQGTEMGFGFAFDDVVYGVQYRAEWSGKTTFNATGGIYSVVYDTETNKLTFKHAPKGLGDVRIFGDINLPLASQGNGIYSAQTTLEGGAYQFRVDSLGTTVCNGSSFTNGMNGVEYKTDWKAATTFVATEKQKFTFIFDTNTNKIKVFNAPIDTTKVLVAFEDSTLELTSTDGVNYTATASLEAGTYTFRMDEFGVTLGYSGTYTDEIKGIKYNASYSSATTFTATGGSYTFSYNVNTDVLKVTKA